MEIQGFYGNHTSSLQSCHAIPTLSENTLSGQFSHVDSPKVLLVVKTDN